VTSLAFSGLCAYQARWCESSTEAIGFPSSFVSQYYFYVFFSPEPITDWKGIGTLVMI
jgi:hypothetical protein